MEVSRRTAIGLGAAATAGIFLGGCAHDLSTITPIPLAEPTPEPNETQQWIESTRQRILEFTVESFQDEQKRNEFIRDLANTYVKLSGTTRLTQQQMVAPEHLILAPTREAFVADFRTRNPGLDLPSNMISTAFTNTPDRRTTLDMEGFVQMRTKKNDHAGIALASILMHEWGHADITDRTEGVLLNNSTNEFTAELNGEKLLWDKYRGAGVHSGKTEQLVRFQEIVNESIMIMRMRTHLGLIPIDSSYTVVGADFFVPLMSKLGVSVEELYTYYSTSDLEGLASRIGRVLPGDETDLMKGLNFAFSVNSNDANVVINTGVFDIYPDIYPNPEGR